jgi:1-acyl-sn-glycerol-3-phosphate acyltransferase
MSVVFSRPYQFVPPDEGNLWPFLIQRLRVVDWHLKRKEGVVAYECRGMDHVRVSLEAGDGILLAPNHCRYADPLVMGWPARLLGTHVFAMASWHLFNEGWFDAFAIRKLGGFSIYREGTDRQSLQTAIDILANATRPLILFPEGSTNRLNDFLMPLLEGVTFIARSAARRRAKQAGGRVVIHPVAIKYLCETDIDPWATRQLDNLEQRIGWHPRGDQSILNRTVRLAEALLSLKEIAYLGRSQAGNLPQRRDALIEHLLATTERHLGIDGDEPLVRERVRQIRTVVSTRFFDPATSTSEQQDLRRDVAAAMLAQELLTYRESYLRPDTVTDTRIVETIQRMQESFLGKADNSIPLKAVIEFDQAIEVPAEKAPRGQADPILQQLADRLTAMLDQLSTEARPL